VAAPIPLIERMTRRDARAVELRRHLPAIAARLFGMGARRVRLFGSLATGAKARREGRGRSRGPGAARGRGRIAHRDDAMREDLRIDAAKPRVVEGLAAWMKRPVGLEE
jgi:chloramphenicol 3-O-phosphotransferase